MMNFIQAKREIKTNLSSKDLLKQWREYTKATHVASTVSWIKARGFINQF